MVTSDSQQEYAEDHGPDDVLDEEWLASTQHRPLLRTVLVLVLAASIVFLGGVLVQREFGNVNAASAGGAVGELPGGLAQGLANGLPSNMPQAGSGQAPPGTGQDSTPDESRVSIVGTIVAIDGDVWTVEDLGGTRHRVAVPKDADIVRESAISAQNVKIDTTVDITLTTGETGTEIAGSVVLR